MSDRELARQLRRTMDAVISQRLIHGIPGYTRKEKWTRFDETLLGTVPDAVAARELGRSELAVVIRRCMLGIPKSDSKQRRYTAEEDRLLGTMPDEELARRLGRTPDAIQVHRAAVGVGAFGSKHGSRGVKHRGPVWTPEELALLGKLPDREIMLRFGRSARAVQAKRFKLGLKYPSLRKP
jgi:hypothetical protein